MVDIVRRLHAALRVIAGIALSGVGVAVARYGFDRGEFTAALAGLAVALVLSVSPSPSKESPSSHTPCWTNARPDAVFANA